MMRFAQATGDQARSGTDVRRWPARWVLVVTCATVLAVHAALPAAAYAWWGKLEKLSGAGPFSGETYEFRVVCFGETSRASQLTAEAIDLSARARARERMPGNDNDWDDAAAKWVQAGEAWARELHEPFTLPTPGQGSRQTAEDLEIELASTARRGRAMLTATSSAGVLWSLCKPDKQRRLALDLGWTTWDAKPDPGYAGGAPINLDMLVSSVSWRLLADTKFDFVELSAGGGVYWFTSTGFEALNGVVLQPGRLTFRAPSSWSGARLSDWRRWAAIPSYAVGITMFPAGFEPDDFAGVGDKAVRLPRELIRTQYIFLNVEPFLRMFGK